MVRLDYGGAIMNSIKITFNKGKLSYSTDIDGEDKNKEKDTDKYLAIDALMAFFKAVGV